MNRADGNVPGTPVADTMTVSDALHTVRTFGDRRRLKADAFTEAEDLEGSFFYETAPRTSASSSGAGATSGR